MTESEITEKGLIERKEENVGSDDNSKIKEKISEYHKF